MARQAFARARQAKEWRVMAAISRGFTADATNTGGSLNFSQPATVLRMLGEYSIQATSAPVALDAVYVTVAVGVVSTDARNLGATAMPDPAEEPEYPWLFWASHLMRWNSSTISENDGSGYLRRAIDIRSMRKIKPRETLTWVFQYEDGGGNPPINVQNELTRVLVGLH